MGTLKTPTETALAIEGAMLKLGIIREVAVEQNYPYVFGLASDSIALLAEVWQPDALDVPRKP